MSLFQNLSNKNYNSTDRFIQSRSSLDFELSNYKLTSIDQFSKYDQPRDIFHQKPSDYYKKNYVKLLWSTMNKKNMKVFSNDCLKKNNRYEWPSYPRKKPLITKPEFILDLPSSLQNESRCCIDWSKRGYVTTICEDIVFLWSYKATDKHKEEEFITTNILAKRAIKWDNAGLNLAIAEETSIKIWCFQSEKIIGRNFCKCSFLSCQVRVFCWSNDDQLLACGCDNGWITVFTSNLHTAVSRVKAHYLIIVMCLSPRNKLLCSSGRYGTVKIWKWPTLEGVFQIKYPDIIATLEFHPWNDSLLALGGRGLYLWNIASNEELDYVYSRKGWVDALTWNPLTGELVTSHSFLSGNRISVLSNFNTLVDTMTEHTGRVVYLKWSPDNTQLATGVRNEYLCIWNYFGFETERYKKKKTTIDCDSVFCSFRYIR